MKWQQYVYCIEQNSHRSSTNKEELGGLLFQNKLSLRNSKIKLVKFPGYSIKGSKRSPYYKQYIQNKGQYKRSCTDEHKYLNKMYFYGGGLLTERLEIRRAIRFKSLVRLSVMTSKSSLAVSKSLKRSRIQTREE